MRYTFGAYTLDLHSYELCQAGMPLHLQPKVFDLLAYLLQHRDRAVTRQELFDTLWPEHLVSDDALEWIVAAARRAVGDSGRAQRVIQTVRSRGYRWVAPVAVHASVLPDAEGLTPAARAPGATDHAAMPSPVAGERKQVTVLAGVLSPVVAQAAGMDPEMLYTIQQRVFTVAQQAIRHYAGTFQSVVDQAFLAVFGAPVAQEDHARRAVLAALHIQDSLRPLDATPAPGTGQEWAVCLGVHTGEAIVGAIGDDRQQIVLTVGDTTQVAQALLRLAEPGAILLSAATSRLVRDCIRLERVSLVNVQGATAPQTVYKVLDLAPPTAVGWQGRRVVRQFVGRVPEMATLQALLAQVEAGHGHVVGLAGEPGIGKSRLLYEFRQQVPQQSCTLLLGRCVSYGQATPYLPLLDLVRQACGVSERDTPEATAARVSQYLQRIGLEPAEHAPYVLRLLNLPNRLVPVESLSPGELRTRIFTTLLQMHLAASQQRPLLLAVEDVHWIDPTSEEWLLQLVERLVSAPILLLVSYRSGYQPAWLSKSYATQLALPRLTADDSRRIVQTVLPARLVSDGLVQTIVTMGEGNPFFLEELAQTVADRGAPSPTLALPETVQAVLAARLDRLPPAAKALAQVAAVIGTEVPGVLLQAVTALADTTLQHHLAPLRDAELLYEARSVPAPVYAFKHALTHEVAYQSLLRSTRQHYHRQVADVLVTRFADRVEIQPEVVAHHYTEAGLPTQALPYWQRAGDRAAEQSAHREARVHCTRGLTVLAMLPETQERATHELRLQVRLGITQMALDGFGAPSAQRTFERALALGPQVEDSPYVPMVFRALATSYFFQGKLPQAQAMAERLLSLSQRIGSRWHGQGAHLQLGQVAYRLGELIAARAHGESALTLSDPERDGRGVEMGVDMRVDIRAHLALCLWDLGYPDQARARVQEALVLARQRAHPLSLALALLRAAYIQAQCGAWQEVQTHAETLLRLATDLGLTWFRAYALHARGHALATQGHAAAGIAQMQQGLAALQGHGEPYQAYVRACLAEVYGRDGQAEAGLALLAEARADLPGRTVLGRTTRLRATPEAGVRCGSAARRELGGGAGYPGIPTATPSTPGAERRYTPAEATVVIGKIAFTFPTQETCMERNTCKVSLTLTALVVLGLAAYSPAAAQKFSAWSAPVNLGPTINSPFTEAGPTISKKGRSLYFYSSRPGGFGGNDIWVSQRTTPDAPWGSPVNLGPNINTGSSENTPSLSRDGHWLFFASDRPGGFGGSDIWASWRAHTHDDFGWQPPVNLGAGVNSATFDAAPNYFENEDVGIPLLFFTSFQPIGALDTYVSELASDGSFGPAALVPELNSPQSDGRPNIRHDGREIFFYSNRPGTIGLEDLWVATRETTLDAWSTPVSLGPTVNSASRDIHPAVSFDSQTLFFGSDRPDPDGVGGFDLYMTTRTKLRRR